MQLPIIDIMLTNNINQEVAFFLLYLNYNIIKKIKQRRKY